ncbi:MAG TPA: hypothetical protein VF407_21895 [Polyangiaceae bacterium]
MLKKLGVLAIVIGSCTSVLAAGCSSSSDTNGGSSEEDSGGGGGKKDGGSTDGGGFGEEDSGGKKDSGSPKDSGSSEEDGSVTPPKSDAGGGGLPTDGGVITPVTDAGTKADGGVTADGGVVACYDLAAAKPSTIDSAPAAHQGLCTATQITSFYNDCWAATGFLGSGSCQTFLQTNNDCAVCLVGAEDGNTPSPVVAFETATIVDLNYAGCIASLSAASDACKLTFTEQRACDLGACTSCATDSDFNGCFEQANSDSATNACSVRFGLDASCIDPLNNAITSTGVQTSCGSGLSGQALVTKIATTMCGAP